MGIHLRHATRFFPLSRFGRFAIVGGVALSAALPGIAQRAQNLQSAPKTRQVSPPANIPRPTFAPQTKRPPLLSPNEYLPVSQLRGGMKGYGLTVFHGNKIERFEVTILGVVKKANNGRDLILVKLGGPKMKRVTDVIAGMSGSPVYVNGKIVGAVAYGASFTRESMGYLTPIEDMLDAWDTNLPQSAESAAVPAGMKPLLAKVTVSGVSGPRMTRIASELAKLGIEARQGGGRASSGLVGSPLTPGGAVAMSLATGDLDVTAVGTLTYRRGNQVVAFGHPFLGIGPIEAPMFSAYIHDIQPSFSESEKIGSPVKLVGSFSQDRPFSVGGRIGVVPRLIPITVRVNDKSMGKQRVFRAQLLRHPQLTPTLAALAAGTAVSEIHGQPGDAMATVTTEVVADGVGKLSHTSRLFDDAAMDEAAVTDLRNVLSLMSGNPFYPVGVRSVNMTVDIEAGRRTAQVERIFLKQSRFEPGDTVDVGVVLKPFKQPTFTRMMRIRIPSSAPSGTLLLTVQGGSATGLSSLVSLLSGARAPEYATAATVEQILHRWEERERGDDIVARLTLSTGTISVRGERLDGLPTNIENAMRAGMSRTSGTRVDRDEVKVSTLTDYIVSGAQVLPIQVVRPGGPTGPTAPVPVAPSGTATLPGGIISIAPPPSAVSSLSGIEQDEQARTALSGQTPAPIRVPTAPPTTGSNAILQTGATVPAAVTVVPPAATAPVPAPTATLTVGRQPGIWRQATPADFRSGTLRGVAVSETGQVSVAPHLSRVTESEEPFFWSVVPDGNGGTYAGSGDQGIIYHVSAGGKRATYAQTGEVSIHALCRSADGTLYAGTSPGGRILRITSEGKVSTLFQTGGKHVLALALSPDGSQLYAGVGGGSPAKARVYAVPLASPTIAKTIYEGADDSVSSLAVAPSGDVYAGTSPGGLIVKIPAMGAATTVLYDTPETAISGLVAEAGDVLYAATAPRGQVYRLAPGTAPRTVFERTTTTVTAGSLAGLYALVAGGDGRLYTAFGSSIVAITPGENGRSDTFQMFEAPSDIQILALAPGDEGTLWAATGSVGSVYALRTSATGGATATTGEYVSPVFDARAVSQWGTVRWTSDTQGTVALQTRTGNTSEPDASWSAWSRPYVASGGEPVASPPARYVQYRADLAGGATLANVELFYLPPNQAPQLTLLSPRGGEVWRGTQTLRWSANDADRDALSYEVYVSGDGGKSWQSVSRGARATPVSASHAAAIAPTRTAPTAIETELAQHPEISAEMKAKILADAQRAGAPTAAAPANTSATATRDTSASLDTLRLADGNYLVRVVASDRPANPTGALSTERVSGSFRVLNRAPQLTLLASATRYESDRAVRLEGIAQHPTAGALIRGVQFRVDRGEWSAAVANDGIFDGNLEAFTLVTTPLAAGAHTVEVQVQDEAGNTATKTTTVIAR